MTAAETTWRPCRERPPLSVATRLHSALASPSPASSVSPKAHDAYLRGWYFLEKREADKSAGYFQQAISIDPSWSQAYSGFAEAIHSEGVLGMMSQVDAVVKTEAAARRAIELDPQNGQAYSTLGLTQGIFEWNWADAEQNLKRGVALSPSNSHAELEYANYLVAVNHPEQAVQHMRRALELDPQSFMMNRHIGDDSVHSAALRRSAHSSSASCGDGARQARHKSSSGGAGFTRRRECEIKQWILTF